MSAPPTGVLFYEGRAKPLNTVGGIQPGAYYQFYLTGTLTFANVYSDGSLASPLSQTPGSGGTTAASDGRLVPIYLDPTITYRYQLYSAVGVLLEDIDPYIPSTASPLTQAQFNTFLASATVATSASGEAILGGGSVVTPNDLANSPVLPIPFSEQGTNGDLFLVNYNVDFSGSGVQAKLIQGGTGNGFLPVGAGVLAYNTPGGTPIGAGVYATTFSFNLGYKALLTDGPSLLRGSGVDVCLGTLTAGPGTAIQGQGIISGVTKTAGAFAGFNTTPSINAALWVKSYDTTNYLAAYSEAGNWVLTGGNGDNFSVTNAGVGTCVKGQQAGGGHGAVGFNDGTRNAAVYGDDNGSGTNYAAYFNGKGFVASAWTVSDGRLKRNIVEVPNALEDIKKLRVVEYDKLAMPTKEHPEERVLVHEVGVIAQELQKIMPGAVDTDGQWLTVSDREVLYRLVRAVQELSEKIKS